MATDDEILLDAFVRVSPDPEFLSAVDKVADDAIKRITEKFASVTIPGPRISEGSGAAGAVQQQISQLATLNSQQQAAEQRREQAAQRLLDLQREIENLQGRGRTTFTPASRERAIQAEVRATEELQRAQREYARLLSANDPSVSSEDAAIQKQIVEYQKERNQAEKDYRQSIIDVEQAQLKAARFEKPSRSKFTAEAVAAAQAERDRIAASGAGAVEIAAAELRLEEIRTKFAASQSKRTKDAQKAQDDLQAAIIRSTEAESRRVALSAEIVTDTDALAKARIAAEQRVAEASERVAAARAAVTRQDEGAQRYTETRATRLAAAQNELVSATQAEADARQQVLNINEQILATTRAQQAAEAAVTAEVQRQAQANESSKSSSGNAPSAAPDLESSRTSLIAKNLAESNRLADELVAAEQRVSEAAQRVAAARSAIPNAVSPEPRENGVSDPALRKAEGLEGEVKAQTELVSAIQAEADAQQQALNIKEQIIATAQAHRAAEAAITEELQRQAQASSAAGSNPPPGQPPVPGDSGQPPRRRGRGRRGQTPPPPPDPPTTPPDDDGEADELARAYLAATRQVQDLSAAIRRLKLTGVEINADGVKKDLTLINEQLKDVQTQLRRGAQDQDAFGIEAAINRIPDLQSRIDQLVLKTTNQRVLREDFDAVSETARRTIEDGRRAAGLERTLNPGIVRGQDREDLILYTNEIRKQEAEVNRLRASFDGTRQSVSRLTEAEQVLVAKQQQLAEKENLIAQTRGRSFNTLSNNAYQLGQAFEDFSVGFSLNGLAGGIRGAANNVAFILNDLSRLESTKALTTDIFSRFRKDMPVKQARELGERMAGLIPLAAGIGGAVAITIVPAMAEWLASLNDVELKLIDIQDRIKETSGDVNFASGLRSSNDELIETLRTAGSVKEIIEEIKRLNFESTQGQKGVAELFQGFTDSGDISDTLKNITSIRAKIDSDFIRDARILAERNFDVDLSSPDSLGSPAVKVDAEEKARRVAEYERAKELQKNFKDAYDAIAAAQNEVISGGDKQAEKIAKANEEYRILLKTIDELEKKKAFGDVQNLEDAKQQIKAFGDELEVIAKKSAEIANIQNKQLPDALQAVVDVSDRLAFGLDAARANAKGLIDDEALLLLQLQESNNEFRTRLDLLLEEARAKGVAPELVNEANRKATNTQFRLEELEILKKIRELEEEITDEGKKRSGRAKFTEFEQFAKDLQVNVLGPEDENRDVIKENTEQIRKLKDLLALMRQNRNENLQELPIDPRRLGQELEKRREEYNEELKRIILPPEKRFMLMIEDLKDTVEDATGFRYEGKTPSLPGPNFDFSDLIPKSVPASLPELILSSGIADAITKGIQEGLKWISNPIVNEQKNTTEAVKKIQTGAVAR